jgi:hypothetical protein
MCRSMAQLDHLGFPQLKQNWKKKLLELWYHRYYAYFSLLICSIFHSVRKMCNLCRISKVNLCWCDMVRKITVLPEWVNESWIFWILLPSSTDLPILSPIYSTAVVYSDKLNKNYRWMRFIPPPMSLTDDNLERWLRGIPLVVQIHIHKKKLSLVKKD